MIFTPTFLIYLLEHNLGGRQLMLLEILVIVAGAGLDDRMT